MTELIIIGNGFDLAHGMKTAYKDYIRAMLLDVLAYAPKYGEISPFYIGSDRNVHALHINATLFHKIKANIISNTELSNTYRDLARKSKFRLSPLISLLLKDFENKGWVDLEQSYFDILCKSYTDGEEIEQLNEDMKLLEKSLHSYLKDGGRILPSQTIKKYIDRIIDKKEKQRLENLRIQRKDEKDTLSKSLDKFDPFINPNFDTKGITRRIDQLEQEIQTLNWELELLTDQKPIVLNFNYTNTIGLYFKEDEYIHIPIHNTLDDDEIILGYGDETCEMYKTLENANNNELLKYFKSFYYMQNSRYRDLERIISSDKFRIHIMGHSCGLSDKVLLSHLFNHENLDTIRIYYHDKGNKKNDFFEKCQNISRLAVDKHRIRYKILPPSQDHTDMERSVPLVPYMDKI